jgi:hypothetical protein
MSLAEEVHTVRQRIAARLRELEPLVHEYNELRQLADEMGLEHGQESPPSESPEAPDAQAARGGAARRGARAQTRSEGPRAPQRSAPPRSAQASAGRVGERVLEAVRADPGKTVAEYAAILQISATSLYRPVRELTNDGALVKRARQLFPA